MKKWIILIVAILILGFIVVLLLNSSHWINKPVEKIENVISLTATEASTPVATTTLKIEPTLTNTPIPTLYSPVVPAADEAAERLSVPSGFAVRIFADELIGKPRFMAVGPDRQIYISLFDAGTIARLPDRNLDGLSDRIEIVASGLTFPHGLEWKDGWLYVAEIDGVSRMRDEDGEGVFELVEKVIEGIPGEPGHISRTIHFGPDGMLYLSVGSSCNLCVEEDPRRASILRFNPDGSIPADNPFANDEDFRRRPVWAWGLRNVVDFLWTPSGQLWADHNGRDRMLNAEGNSNTLPPEEIIIPVQKGMSHGWPYCFTNLVGYNQNGVSENLDWQNGLTLPDGFDCSISNVVSALYTDVAHSAPLGMMLGDTQLAFPLDYQSNLYVAYHGSWNTNKLSFRDCKVVRILLNGEVPIGQEDFVNGFRAPGQRCGKDPTWGRPADVIIGADGAMYISDDRGGRVLRVVYIGE